MKLLKYILAFYLILLSVVPCCAFDRCPDDKAESQQNAGHDDDNDRGSCSPFFNCEGCASVTFHVQSISFMAFNPGIKRVYAAFISPLIPDAHYDFWRPPQLS
jgi:hypothetical protein